jgi:hypothetical protein
MTTLRIHVNVSADELMRWYRGEVSRMIAISDDGRRVSLPVEHLRRFVQPGGLRGAFLLTLDGCGRFVRLSRAGARSRAAR